LKRLKLYTIKDAYIEYLRTFDNKVMLNKDAKRKYIGVVLSIDNFNYFVPLSSPKDEDYIIKDGIKKIKSNTNSQKRMKNYD
jgi:protein AbiQ